MKPIAPASLLSLSARDLSELAPVQFPNTMKQTAMNDGRFDCEIRGLLPYAAREFNSESLPKSSEIELVK